MHAPVRPIEAPQDRNAHDAETRTLYKRAFSQEFVLRVDSLERVSF